MPANRYHGMTSMQRNGRQHQRSRVRLKQGLPCIKGRSGTEGARKKQRMEPHFVGQWIHHEPVMCDTQLDEMLQVLGSSTLGRSRAAGTVIRSGQLPQRHLFGGAPGIFSRPG